MIIAEPGAMKDITTKLENDEDEEMS